MEVQRLLCDEDNSAITHSTQDHAFSYSIAGLTGTEDTCVLSSSFGGRESFKRPQNTDGRQTICSFVLLV